MSHYFHELFEHSDVNVKAELDLAKLSTKGQSKKTIKHSFTYNVIKNRFG